jgi:hypothetical protein
LAATPTLRVRGATQTEEDVALTFLDALDEAGFDVVSRTK